MKTYDNHTDIDGKTVIPGDRIVFVGTGSYGPKPRLKSGIVVSFTPKGQARIRVPEHRYEVRNYRTGEITEKVIPEHVTPIGHSAVFRVNEREDER